MSKVMRLSAVLATLYLVACAANPAPKATSAYRPQSETVSTPDAAKHFIILIGSGGCGCPFDPYLAYTPNHVLEAMDGKPVWVKEDGSEVKLEIVERDPEGDFGVVRSPEPFPYWTERADAAPEVGDPVVTIGRSDFLFSRSNVVFTIGTILGSSPGYLLIDALSFPGMSGGCVVDRQAKLVGLHIGNRIWPKRPDIRGVAVSIPVWK